MESDEATMLANVDGSDFAFCGEDTKWEARGDLRGRFVVSITKPQRDAGDDTDRRFGTTFRCEANVEVGAAMNDCTAAVTADTADDEARLAPFDDGGRRAAAAAMDCFTAVAAVDDGFFEVAGGVAVSASETCPAAWEDSERFETDRAEVSLATGAPGACSGSSEVAGTASHCEPF